MNARARHTALSVAATVGALLAPAEVAACSPPSICAAAAVFPEGETLPANGAFEWWEASGAVATTGVRLQRLDVETWTDVPVDATLGSGARFATIRPREALPAGARVRLTLGGTCPPRGGGDPREFVTTEAAPLPTTLGTLVAGEPVLGDIPHGPYAGSHCADAASAVTVAVSVALSPQARPWESSLFYDVRVDGESFFGITEFGSPGAPIAPGRTHHGRGSARLAVICGPARNPFGPPQAVHYASGLREGEHDVVFRARVAASEAWIETAPLRVTLRCPPAPVDAGSALDAAASTDGGGATDGGVVTDRGFAADGDAAPDGGRGVDAGGGCSASPRGARGGAACVAVLLLALARARRARAGSSRRRPGAGRLACVAALTGGCVGAMPVPAAAPDARPVADAAPMEAEVRDVALAEDASPMQDLSPVQDASPLDAARPDVREWDAGARCALDASDCRAVVQLSVRQASSCARRAGGGVDCWGFNGNHALGNGEVAGDRATPSPVWGLDDATLLAPGPCARRASGEWLCWGVDPPRGRSGIVPEPQPWMGGMVQVSSSDGSHTCGRLGSGAVACWGNNGSGQLGDGTTTARRDPVPVVGLTDAVDVAAGSTHTCALRARGEVVCWGSNFYGELGDNGRTQRLVPTPVAWARGTPVDVEAGYHHTCARREDGSVVCWGQNAGGLLGDGSEVTHRAAPFPVTGVTDARALGLAGSHACVLRATGEVACWGTLPRSAGAPVVNHRTPTTLPGLAEVVEIVVASDHDCARLADGSVVCWGQNERGMLGDGTMVERAAPTRVVGLP